MPTIATHTPQEISVLYRQLSAEQQQDIYLSLLKMLRLNNVTQTSFAQSVSLFDYFKNADPAIADIDLEITPRKEQLSRDFNFE
ncbi:MAG: hypothetical protein IKZ88_04825 [Neisseriaceae bacterium]|nr:hypothetical protein [Neisseriaceae bacterium]